MDELALFAVNRGPEVMGEVLRAAARSFEPFNPLNPPYPGRICISVSVDQGWGGPDTVKLADFNLRKLDAVAQAVGVTYNIVEVDMAHCVPGKRCQALSSWFNVKILGRIANHMEEQTESMDSLKLCAWDSDQYQVSKMHFSSLLKVTKEWRIGHINSVVAFYQFFADLPTECAAAGRLDRIYIDEEDKSTSLEVMKRIWGISVDVGLCTRTATGINCISVGGGKGENPEAGWQQFLEYFHDN